jgi:hypothetical protein
MRGCLELQQGKSKVDVLKRVIGSMEAIQLYMQPLNVLSQEHPTICDGMRAFYTSHPLSFFRTAYARICGYEPPEINEQWIRFICQGIGARTLFIGILIEDQYGEKVVNGYYPSVRDWITTEGQNRQHVHILYNKERIHMSKASGIENSLEWDQLINQMEIPEQFIVDIPQGHYWGEYHGAVMTSNYKIIGDISREIFYYYVFQNKKLPFPEYMDGRIAVLYSYLGTNYFHYMFDVAARIHLLQKSNLPIDQYVVDTQLPFQDEMLTLLGIEKEKRIQMNSTLFLKARHLIIPSYNIKDGMIPRWVCDFLRRELLFNRKVEKIQGYERIYISREKATRRKVKNEDEVMELLQPFGFKRVYLEQEPLVRKIEIFHSARVIVAPHGAGLANLIFCNPGTKVVEFFNSAWMRPSFRLISQYVGLDYYYFFGQESSVPYQAKDYKRLLDDIIVEKEKLIRALKEVLK